MRKARLLFPKLCFKTSEYEAVVELLTHISGVTACSAIVYDCPRIASRVGEAGKRGEDGIAGALGVLGEERAAVLRPGCEWDRSCAMELPCYCGAVD